MLKMIDLEQRLVTLFNGKDGNRWITETYVVVVDTETGEIIETEKQYNKLTYLNRRKVYLNRDFSLLFMIQYCRIDEGVIRWSRNANCD